MRICENCGCEVDNISQFCENCGKYVSKQQVLNTNEQKKHNKNKGIVIGVIITVIITIISRFIGGAAGKFLANSFFEKNEINKINSYIESMDDYVPGILNDEKYISEHFDFQFQSNDNWIMYTEKELENVSDGLRQTTVSATVEALKADDVDEETIEMLKETIYCDAEMGAAYISDGIIVGETYVGVFSSYGMGGLDSDEIVNIIKRDFSSVSDVVSSGAEIIAGERYDFIKLSLIVEDVELVNQFFLQEKDGMICLITCRSLPGYEDEIFATFKKQVSQYTK